MSGETEHNTCLQELRVRTETQERGAGAEEKSEDVGRVERRSLRDASSRL